MAFFTAQQGNENKQPIGEKNAEIAPQDPRIDGLKHPIITI